MKLTVKALSRIALTACLVGGTIYWVDWSDTVFVLSGTPFWVVAVGLLLGSIRIIGAGIRWYLVESTDYPGRSLPPGSEKDLVQPLTFLTCIRYKWAASAANLVAPAIIGADIGRILLVSYEHAHQRMERVSVVILDRIIGLSSLALIGTIAAVGSTNLNHSPTFTLFFGMMLATLLAILFYSPRKFDLTKQARNYQHFLLDRLIAFLHAFSETRSRLRSNQKLVFSAFLLSILVHFASFAIVYLAAYSYGAPGGLWFYAAITSLSWISALAPIGILGFSLREVTLIFLLTNQGIDPVTATAISLFQYAVAAIISLFGLPLVALTKKAQPPLSSNNLKP